ncbi:MAG: zinc ribbon domain-containing protein [Dehalococcoidales bacterium]|nr:zinc ribbon domain-containing protein [Dehalococcoidales bacterium]MDP6737545.1 zinc ribbon domain-containing protein [Dehalococcoidales bacterium]
MPIYEYQCLECEFKFELLRPLSRSGEDAACPHCRECSPRVLSTFASFSVTEGGVAAPLGGNSCGGCASTSCGTCAV